MTQSPNPRLISQAEFARLIGVARQSVNKAIKTGRISTSDGKIDPEIASKQWAKNTDPSAPNGIMAGDLFPHMKPAKIVKKKSRATSKPGADHNGDAPAGTATYIAHRARREAAAAETAELNLRKLRGELVVAEEVRQAAFIHARRCRDLLLALPERLAPTLAAITDPDELLHHLEGEIEIICRELANGNGKGHHGEGES
jgi:hypothetical protein